ncbi:amidohydrolase [Microbacterium sp. W4I20]|uniref:amidohydrolase n=1 Tax=Microbacterium sp. W4I20 TaxID=3042262 RepID=UPI00278A9AC7|nr:amidohydrolase [Microbacterium sp. W4I20]MDQ0728813.1 putative amidohydrolase YtcJ [Microbacterium sp. W4I20]
MSGQTIIARGRILDPARSDQADFSASASPTDIVVENARITALRGNVTPSASDTVIDAHDTVLLPGFVDSHVHLVWTGQSLANVALTDAADLGEIQARLRAERERLGADATILRGRGWLFDAIDGEPTAAMIDEVVDDIPVYLDSNDMHSVWVNTAAIRALGIDATTPDPAAGRLSRLPSGEPAGMLYERAAHEIGWAHLAANTGDDDRVASVLRALDAFAAAGVTSVVDMGMDEAGWRALKAAQAERGGTLPVRVSAHWLVADFGDDEQNLAQVRRAAEVSDHASEWLAMIGIKLVLDGVIDACTAAMTYPYADGSNGDLMWDPTRLERVSLAADAAGLRIAMHAIGDHASDVALDVLESVIAMNPAWDRRPRLEHLEVVSEGTPVRMAALGITASVQPVHADPAIQPNWRAQLGDDRVEGGYPWRSFTDAGALMAFGTDAPTAPHEALDNLYIATTRRSVLDPSLPAHTLHSVVSPDAALRHATVDSAASFAADDRIGRLEPGYLADLVALDRRPLDDDGFRTNAVAFTMVGGRIVYRRGA